jgi:sterol desaturase/sphingolipid hydroxylase (fatty acid hydroxylase superfamily)
MDVIYGRVIAWAAPVFLAAVTAEVMVDRARGTRYYSLSDAITSVGCGTAFIGARVSFGFIGLLAYEYVLQNLAPGILPISSWLTWLFAFVLYDLCYYWWHRLSHTVAFLWGSHVVHHQSKEFNLTTALRQPASAFLTGWPFYIPLALCGVPLVVYLIVGVAQLCTSSGRTRGTSAAWDSLTAGSRRRRTTGFTTRATAAISTRTT